MRAGWVLGITAALAPACGGGDDDDAPADRCVVPEGGPGFDPDGPMCDRLSSYRLFDDANAQAPADGVVPFELNTPLFSDYADKSRFLFVPPGEAMQWDDVESFAMPVGTIIAKTFWYPHDKRDPAAGRDLIETRILLHRADGWEAAAYVYDDADEEAHLAVAGARVDVAWTHDDGEARTVEFAVPDKNQCKNCHEELDDTVGPLGPKARHMNRAGRADSGIDDQLQHLIDAGALAGAPAPGSWPKAPAFDDPDAGTLEARARAWLDINCAHCHNPRGAARTSGLDLSLAQTEPYEYGVCKGPVAAGMGSGGRPYSIVPGDPDQSILVYRLESTEAEIKMPEVGRSLVHEEGVAVIRAWIAAMKGSCEPQP